MKESRTTVKGGGKRTLTRGGERWGTSVDHWAAIVLSENTYDHVSKCTVRFCFCSKAMQEMVGQKKCNKSRIKETVQKNTATTL